MAGMGKVNPNLVRSAGLQSKSHLAYGNSAVTAGISFDDPIMGYCSATQSSPCHRDPGSILWAASERRIDAARRSLKAAPGESEVCPLKASIGTMSCELLCQAMMGSIRLGDDNEAACILVEPVHDAGALDATNAGQAGPTVCDQGVDQRSTGVPRRRMDDQAGRLVDHDQVGVFPHDLEWDRFGLGLGRLGRRYVDDERHAGFDPCAGVTYGPVPIAYVARFDQRLDAGAAQHFQSRRKEPVDALAPGLGRHLEAHTLGMLAHR